MNLHDYPLMIRLPAERTCFIHNVISGTEQTLTEAQCDDAVARAIYLTSAAWALMKEDIQTNCQEQQCTQLTGAFDDVFLSIDKALQEIPQ